MTTELHDSEVATLNAARDALQRIHERVGGPSLGEGRLLEALDHADNAIFRVLNVAASYCGVELTYAEIHNRPEPTPDAT